MDTLESFEDKAVPENKALVKLLHIQIENANKAGVAPLSEEQCTRVMEEGYKAHNSSCSSSGLGLASVAKATSTALEFVVATSPAAIIRRVTT